MAMKIFTAENNADGLVKALRDTPEVHAFETTLDQFEAAVTKLGEELLRTPQANTRPAEIEKLETFALLLDDAAQAACQDLLATLGTTGIDVWSSCGEGNAYRVWLKTIDPLTGDQSDVLVCGRDYTT
jgi:hypothetical protein